LKDTSNTRPEAITIEQLEDGLARVSLCMFVSERTTEEGQTAFDFDRYSLVTQYTDNLADRVASNTGAWLDHIIAAETAAKAAEVRHERDQLLAASDAEMTFDRALKLELPEKVTTTTVLAVVKDLFDALGNVYHGAWAAYRQALRDVPQQPGFPWNIQWPRRPE
jgi:hypothetical protein